MLLIKDYLTSLNETEITCLISSMDSKTFFTGDSEGVILQYSTQERKLIKDYGKVHIRAIKVLCSNSLFDVLLSGDIKGDIVLINTRTEEVTKIYKKAHDFPITSIVITPRADCFVSSDAGGNIKFWSFVKDIHRSDPSTVVFNDIQCESSYSDQNATGVYSLSLSLNGKYLFSTDYQGNCKCWLTKDRNVLWDYGKIHNNSFMCIEPGSPSKKVSRSKLENQYTS